MKKIEVLENLRETREQIIEEVKEIAKLDLYELEDAYFYVDSGDSYFNNTMYGEFNNDFKLKATMVEGFYKGTLVLVNVCIIVRETEEIIKISDGEGMPGYFDPEEEDDIDYLIEMYLETLSEWDMWEIFREIIRNTKKYY